MLRPFRHAILLPEQKRRSCVVESIRVFLRFLVRVLAFRLTGKRDPSDHSILLKAFVASQGRFLSVMNLLGREGTGADFSKTENLPNSLNISPDLIIQSVDNLRREGWFKMPFELPAETVKSLNHLLSQGKMRLVSDDKSVNGLIEALNLSEPKAEKYDIPPETFMTDPTVLDLMTDRGLVEIARRYLKADPIVDIGASWHSFPKGRSSSEAATEFHFDLDRLKWVKVFFFLTPIDKLTGSHVFVPGTHLDGGIPSELLSKGYKRLPDKEVADFFPEDMWVIPEGAEGTILLEDTRGLHKGLPLIEGHRLVLQFQYCSSLFGNPSSLAHVESLHGATKNQERNLDSRLFSGIGRG